MQPQEFAGSRGKTALYLAGSLGFVAISLQLRDRPDSVAWKLGLAGGFFGLCAIVFAWLLIRPQRLMLDAEGFSIHGGLVRKPKKTLWRDVEGFFVYRLPKGGRVVGYNYRPGARPSSLMGDLARGFGADAALPKGWRVSPETMADELNAYRLQALGAR